MSRDLVNFDIHIGPRSSFKIVEDVRGDVLVAVKRVPKPWHDELKSIFESREKATTMQVGWISYELEAGRAIYFTYFPKRLLPVPTTAIGFPYFTEAMAVNQLANITDLRDGPATRTLITELGTLPKRKTQLERIEIPIYENIPIGKWLKGLGRGIRESAVYLKQANSNIG